MHHKTHLIESVKSSTHCLKANYKKGRCNQIKKDLRKMDTSFIDSENSKTSDPHKVIVNFTTKIN